MQFLFKYVVPNSLCLFLAGCVFALLVARNESNIGKSNSELRRLEDLHQQSELKNVEYRRLVDELYGKLHRLSEKGHDHAVKSVTIENKLEGLQRLLKDSRDSISVDTLSTLNRTVEAVKQVVYEPRCHCRENRRAPAAQELPPAAATLSAPVELPRLRRIAPDVKSPEDGPSESKIRVFSDNRLGSSRMNAGDKLRFAKHLLEKNPAKARERLRDIVRNHEGTNEAAEAAALLRKA